MQLAENLYGVPKIRMYNAVNVDDASQVVQNYEITQRYIFEYKNGEVVRRAEPWLVREGGKEYYSLLAAPVILQFLRQLVEVFDII